MFMIVRKSDASFRKITDDKAALNYISEDITDRISLEVMEVAVYSEPEIAEFNRIYYIFDGELLLKVNDKETILYKDDAFFIEKGMNFELKGTFKAFIISHPKLQL